MTQALADASDTETALPTASVIICAYTLDRWELMKRSIASALAQTVKPVELFLSVDHNDELLARAREEWPNSNGAAIPVVVVANRYGGRLGSARTTAAEIGYPVLLKATAGGGGRGMRLVTDPADIEDAYGVASAEALTSSIAATASRTRSTAGRDPARTSRASIRRTRSPRACSADAAENTRFRRFPASAGSRSPRTSPRRKRETLAPSLDALRMTASSATKAVRSREGRRSNNGTLTNPVMSWPAPR